MLEPFGPSLYVANGPTVSFFGFPYPTRMAIAPLADGRLWVWSPIALTPQLVDEVNALGRVTDIVSPNKLHHLSLSMWAKQWPDARLHAPPGLARRRRDLSFATTLADRPDPAWADTIDQVVFRGSLLMAEVVFFHAPSSTAIVGDLVQRFDPEEAKGWKGALMRVDGLVGESGSTPREWRASFLHRRPARAARKRVLSWAPERLLIAHGSCVSSGATEVLERALAWI